MSRVSNTRGRPPLDGDRWLLIVTRESFTPDTGDTGERFLRLDAWMPNHTPVGTTSYRWAARDNDVSDGVPLVGPFHLSARHAYVTTGFGGWDMNGGHGRTVAGLHTHRRRTRVGGLYDPRRLWSTLRQGSALLKQQAEVVRHFVGDRLKTTHVDSVAEIAPAQVRSHELGGAVAPCIATRTGPPAPCRRPALRSLPPRKI